MEECMQEVPGSNNTVCSGEVGEFLEYFIDAGKDADYAVLVDGPWGSGKTYFIRSFLDDLLEKKRSAHGGSSSRIDKWFAAARYQGTSDATGRDINVKGYYYASLFGASDIRQVTDQFLSQVLPLVKWKSIRLLGSVVSQVLNVISGREINAPSSNLELLKSLLVSNQNNIVVLDDIERSSIPIQEILGFVASLMMESGNRIILIANQEKIVNGREDQSIHQSFLEVKEKIVGRTFRFTANPVVVLTAMEKEISNQSLLEALSVSKNELLNVLSACEEINFRSLRTALKDFERILAVISTTLSLNDYWISRSIIYTVVTTIEYRRGLLKEEHFLLLARPLYMRSRKMFTKEVDEQEQVVLSLFERFPSVDWYDPIVPPKCLYRLYSAGILDRKGLVEHVKAHESLVDDVDREVWRVLWNWSRLSQARFENGVIRLKRELGERIINRPGELLQIAGILLSLRSFGFVGVYPGEEITKELVQYGRELVEMGNWRIDRELFLRPTTGYESLGFYEAESDEFRFIWTEYSNFNAIALGNYLEASKDQILHELRGDSSHYAMLYKQGFGDRELGRVPFLHRLNAGEYAEIFHADGAPNDLFFSANDQRYRADYNGDVLRVEYKWLNDLFANLRQRVNDLPAPFSNLLSARIESFNANVESQHKKLFGE